MEKEELEEIYNKCIEYSNKIQNPILRDVAKRVYKDYKVQLINKPATPGSHHYYAGGLLFHMYSVTRNAIGICDMYKELEVDKDLVIFGALVHDIGKCNEGTHIIENYLKDYEINEEFKNQVIHMVGSHMNEYSEWGALVLPKMLEVIIINYADSMDAYFEPAHKIIKDAKKGELYKIGNAPRPYYKSLNDYYNL